jgi:hypothetical protein
MCRIGDSKNWGEETGREKSNKIMFRKQRERQYDNMRASRSNEIYAEFGQFYESQWIGHSSKVAKDHYLKVTDDDFSRAAP